MKKKLPVKGEEIVFEMANPKWKHPISIKGRVKETSNIFGGLIYIEEGAKCLDEFIIRVESINNATHNIKRRSSDD